VESYTLKLVRYCIRVSVCVFRRSMKDKDKGSAWVRLFGSTESGTKLTRTQSCTGKGHKSDSFVAHDDNHEEDSLEEGITQRRSMPESYECNA
jgi:hypothetical protein